MCFSRNVRSAPIAASRHAHCRLAVGKSPAGPDNVAMSDSSQPRGFEFPGVFELCAMGACDVELEVQVPAAIEALGLRVFRDRISVRPSSKGNYLSVRVVFEAQSRDDYDAAHGALRALPDVKWTL